MNVDNTTTSVKIGKDTKKRYLNIIQALQEDVSIEKICGHENCTPRTIERAQR